MNEIEYYGNVLRIIIIFPALGFCLLILLYRVRQSTYRQFGWLLVVFILLYSLFMGSWSIAVARTMYKGMELVLPVIALVIALVAYFSIEHREESKRKNEISLFKSYWSKHGLMLFLIVFTQLSPIVSSMFATTTCNDMNRELVQPLIEALQEYKRNNSQYPSQLHPLIPHYIKALPELGCFGVGTNDTAIQMEYCSHNNEYSRLQVAALGSSVPQTYDLVAERWLSQNEIRWC